MKNEITIQQPGNWLFRAILTISLFALYGAASAAPVTVFQEGYESDGSGTRYTVENPSDDGSKDYFARRREGSSGTTVRGGAITGEFYWAARDLDGDGVETLDPITGEVILEDHEARITWNDPIDISGLGNLVIKVAAAQGNDGQEYDNPIAFQFKIDGGPWITAGGFRGLHTNSPSYIFVGGNFDVSAGNVPLPTDPRLTRTFKEFEFPMFGTGDELRFRVFVNLNGGSEEYGHDNIRIIGDDSLSFFTLSMNNSTFVETDGPGVASLTITLESAAPAGGVVFSISDSDDNNSEADIPSTATVAEGETSVTVNFDILSDNRFDGNEPIILQVDAVGWARVEIVFTVTNVDSKPNVVVNEFYPSPFNNQPKTQLQGDANGDGVRNDDQDEFMEILNLESFAVDISFWELWDERGPRHIFPANTILEAGQGAVVFGGGKPRGIFGGSLVSVSSQGNFSFGSDGENVSIRAGGSNAAGAIVNDFTYGGDLGTTERSVTRSPDGTGDFTNHETVSTLDPPSETSVSNRPTSFWSPGTKLDGTPFLSFSNTLSIAFDSDSVAESASSVSGTVSLETAAGSGGVTVSLRAEGSNADELSVPATVTIAEGATSADFTATPVNDLELDGDRELSVRATADDIFPAITYITVTDVEPDLFDVVINEVMGSILGTATDFNQNGIEEEPVEDQFIEILNVGSFAVNLKDWSVLVDRTDEPEPELVVHVFRQATILQPQGSIVIFGGGNEAQLREISAEFFGNAAIFVANGSFNGVNLTDGGDASIKLVRGKGFVEDIVEYLDADSDQAMSLVRSPDGSGSFPNLHLAVSSALELASPGRQLDGTAFPGNQPFVAVTDVFRGEDIPGFPGWKASPWYLNYNVDFLPWIYHDEHGWQFMADGNTEAVIFLFDLGLENWIFVNEGSYRWMFLFSDPADWIFSFSDNTPGRRFFQRLSDGSIFSVPAGL